MNMTEWGRLGLDSLKGNCLSNLLEFLNTLPEEWMWLSWSFKRQRTKSFTGGNLGNKYPNTWDQILSRTRNWLRENKIKDQLQQGRRRTWTFPYHILQNKIFLPGPMPSIFNKELMNWQNREMYWKCCEEAPTAGVCHLLLGGGLKCSTRNSAATQLLTGLRDPRDAETRCQRCSFWIFVFICFVTEVGLN